MVPTPVLVEVDYWLRKLDAQDAWEGFVADIAAGSYRLEALGERDLIRAAELERTYVDLRLGLVDASVVAICERLDEPKVATLDRRHLGVVRPSHRSHLELLPA